MSKCYGLVLPLICLSGLTRCGTADDRMIAPESVENTARSEIINGLPASEELVERHGLVRISGGFADGDDCGATYVGESPDQEYWVLTAAHCVSDEESSYSVAFGKNKRSDYDSEDYIPVEEVVIHRQYDEFYFYADIALLRVAEAPNATPSLLAWPAREAEADERIRMSGFGLTSDGGSPSDVLLEADTRVGSRRTCGRALNGGHEDEFYFDDVHICLLDQRDGPDDRRQTTCGGDSGSPSYRENMVQIGLVSFGFRGCPTNQPEVHTRISRFRWWISRITGI